MTASTTTAAAPAASTAADRPAPHSAASSANVRQVDVLVVGAGISGLGAAYHLRKNSPDKQIAVVEAHDAPGGTWHIHRYPGIRSDSDLFTFGYGFKPWRGPSIATAQEIRTYLSEVIEENDLGQYIHYGHKVNAAEWSSEEGQWTVYLTQADGEKVIYTTPFLWMCQGYYKHDEGYTPTWPGMDDFRGQIVHPQHWPEDLDYRNKRVVVIGSGATAATLVPNLTPDAAHVTMLQRTPTFFFARPKTMELADTLRALDTPDEWVHEIMRRAHLVQNEEIVSMARNNPETVRANLLAEARKLLPEGFDVDKHFNPPYRPWQQRIAVIPDGDLFEAISTGKASVVTDGIETFTETGIRTTSGEHLDADIIVTATGFDLSLFGGVEFTVDGAPVDFTQQVTHRGIMITNVPNMAYVFGYFRASWTLRADLVSEYVLRIFDHMEKTGTSVVTARLRPEDADMPLLPFTDDDNFNAGYLMRSQDSMYRRGDREPWVHLKDYHVERDTLPVADLTDGLEYR